MALTTGETLRVGRQRDTARLIDTVRGLEVRTRAKAHQCIAADKEGAVGEEHDEDARGHDVLLVIARVTHEGECELDVRIGLKVAGRLGGRRGVRL